MFKTYEKRKPLRRSENNARIPDGEARKIDKCQENLTMRWVRVRLAGENAAGTAIRAKSTFKPHCIYLGEEEEI